MSDYHGPIVQRSRTSGFQPENWGSNPHGATLVKRLFLTLFIPFLFLFPLVVLTNEKNEVSLYLQITGLLIGLIGIIIWILGFMQLGRRAFAVLPKAKALQTKGIYKYFCHPLYIGIGLTLLGLSLAKGSLLILLYTLLIIIPLNFLRARKEEKILIDEFGKEYLKYKNKTII